MLVKKINQDWSPIEMPHLEMNGFIEITDPEKLILDGMAVAVNEDGTEISTYDLYGIMTEHEQEELREFKAMKAAKVEEDRLKQENENLQKQLDKKEILPTKVDEKTPWNQMVKAGSDMGVYTPGMKKNELIKAINDA